MSRAPIDDNHHKGLIAKNKVSGAAEALTSRTVGSSEALDVALVDGSGGQITTIPTQDAMSATATITRVATSTSSAQLLAANTDRNQATIVNDSAAAILYVKFGTTASATDYSYLLYPNDTLVADRYTGRIDGILSTGTGNAQITELV
jgi:hypothetical protein